MPVETEAITMTLIENVEVLSIADTYALPSDSAEAIAAHVALSDPHTQYALESKLATVATSGSYNDLSDKPGSYELPTATSSVLGGIKIGSNLSISNGVVTANVGTTAGTVAAGDHTHAGVYQPVGNYATGGGTATGNNTGDQTDISGNAGTATRLATPRAINGVNFDGTAAITVTATPTAHASNHATGGSDAITPSSIGAAPVNSPSFTGTPVAPTADAGTNTTQIATTAFVTTAVAGAGGGSPIWTQAEVAVTGATTATLNRWHRCTGTSADYMLTLPSGTTGDWIGVVIDSTCTKFVTVNGAKYWANEWVLLRYNGSAWGKVEGQSIPLVAEMSLASTGTMTSAWQRIQCDTAVSQSVAGMVNTTDGTLVIPRTGRYRVRANTLLAGNTTATVGCGATSNFVVLVLGLQRNSTDGSSNRVLNAPGQNTGIIANTYPFILGSTELNLNAGDYLSGLIGFILVAGGTAGPVYATSSRFAIEEVV